MKLSYSIKIVFAAFFVLGFSNANAQSLKNIGKKAQKAAERGVERTVEKRAEKETSKKTDEAIDVITGKGNKSSQSNKSSAKGTKSDEAGNATTSDIAPTPGSDIVTGSTFFPGGDIFYSEDFSKDAQGDFPAGWETSSGGEIITVDGRKALRFYPNGVYTASNKSLPENYAIEFDLTTNNLAYKGTSGSAFDVMFSNEKTLDKKPVDGAKFRLPLWVGANQYVQVQSWGKNTSGIKNDIQFDLDAKLNTTVHYTLVVNGNRLRVYLDDRKVVDLPSMLKGNLGKNFSFYLWGTDINKYNHIVAVSNIKITREGQDLRSQIKKGNFSTSDILFSSGSDKIQTSSYSLLDEIADAIKSEGTAFKIIGHTDSDGNDASNLSLSKKRAESVKTYLVSKGVSTSKLSVDGKGESEPVASNATADGKAQNRRVEFKKIQ